MAVPLKINGLPQPIPTVPTDDDAIAAPDVKPDSHQLPMIGSGLSRFAMPTLAPNPRRDELNAMRQRDEQTLAKLNAPHLGQAGSKMPGIGGKILHGLSEVAQIPGDMFFPGQMSMIPGTELNNNVRRGQATRGLASIAKEEQDEQNNESKRNLEQAQTRNFNTEAELGPKKEAREEALNDAQITNLLHPQAKTEFEDWRRNNPTAPVSDWLKLQATQKNQKPDTPEQQYLDEYQRLHPGSTIAQATAAYAKDHQAPERPPQLMVMVPNAQGGQTAQVVRPGENIAPGTQTVPGFTKSQEQEAADAKAAKEMENELTLVKTLAAKPSPTNDLAIIMRYIGATKPDSLGKLRLNQNEINLVMGTRSALGDLEALSNKVANGHMLIPEQRKNMVSSMETIMRVQQGYHFDPKGPNGPGWYK